MRFAHLFLPLGGNTTNDLGIAHVLATKTAPAIRPVRHSVQTLCFVTPSCFAASLAPIMLFPVLVTGQFELASEACPVLFWLWAVDWYLRYLAASNQPDNPKSNFIELESSIDFLHLPTKIAALGSVLSGPLIKPLSV